MTSFYDSYDYYKKMLQLQEKLRRSEEERIRLEERFKMLVQESRSRHDACINRLRIRYIEFLEEQRARDKRNRKLLETLERVDDKLASMTAKANRLNALRKQYEAYLRDIYTAADPSATTIVDNATTTVSQSNDRYSRSSGQTTASFSPQVFRFSGNSQTNSTKSRKLVQPSYRAERKVAIAPLPVPRHQLNDTHDISRSRQLILQPMATVNVQNLQQTKEKWSRRDPIGTQASVLQGESLDPSEHRFPSAAFADSDPPFYQPTQSYRQLSFGDGLPRRINLRDTVYGTIPGANAIQQTVCNSLKPLSPSPVSYFEYSWRKSENYLRAKKNSMGDFAAARSLASCSVDGAIRRYDNQKRFSPKGSAWSSLRPWDSRQLAEQHPPEHRTAKTVENELDRYIDKIRRLHRELDAQSVEDICSLNEKEKEKKKEDDENGFSEGRSKESIPKEVERVLALANDLASKTFELDDANIDSGNVGEDRHVELVENTRTDRDAPLPQRNAAVSRANEGREKTLVPAKDKISSDIKLHGLELDPDGNIEKTEKRNTESDGDGGRPGELPADSFEMPLLHRPTDRHAEFTRENIQTADSNDHRYSFDIAEELQLEPWNLSLLQKQVKEIDLETESNKGSKEDNEWVEEEGTERKNETEAEAETEAETEVEAETEADAEAEAEVEGMRVNLQNRNVEYQEHEEYKEHEEHGEIAYNIAAEETQANFLSDANRRNEQEIATGQANEYNDPNYYANYEEYNYDENATYETNREEDYKDHQASSYEANRGGNYDPTANAAYETNQDSNTAYDGNQSNENGNGNEKYQEYAKQSNEQYQTEEYVNEQYGYENQYKIAHDPNAHYQEDSNQQYAYSYEQPYDPIQIQTSDGNVNQPLPYSDYDPDPNVSLLNLQEEKPNAEYNESQKESKKTKAKAATVRGEGEEEKKEDRDTVEKERLSWERELKKKKDTIRSLLDSDTDSTIERNISNTESDFDFN